MDSNLQIISFNVGGLSANKFTELKYFIDCNPNTHIICLQETKFSNISVKQIPGYNCEFKNYVTSNQNIAGGLAIYIKNTINYEHLGVNNQFKSDGSTAIEALAIKLVIDKNRPLILVNLYSRGCDLETLNGLFKELRTIKGPFDVIFTGDFNAHHPAWGSNNSDAEGRAVIEWLDEQDLILLNDGSPTRLNPTGLNSHIDLTAVNARIASASAWATVKDTMGSDHLPQQVTLLNYIAQGTEAQCSGEQKFLLEKANWAQFRDLCSDLSLADVHSQDPNLFCINLTSKILSIAECSIPVSSGKVKARNRVPWWNEACSNAVQARKNALKILKKNPAEHNLLNYRSLKNQAKRVILDAKTQNWKEFCDSAIINKKNTRDFWQKIHRIKGNSFTPVPLLKYKGEIATTPREKAQFLVRHFQSVSSDSNLPVETLNYQKRFETEHQNILNEPGDNSTPLNLPFTITELLSAINSRSNTATGPDKIAYLMFKNMPAITLKIWLNLFNQVYRTGRIPPEWKQATVIPIPKPGKDKNDPNSYRPISLTSHAGKLLEIMVKNRLEHLLESNNILNPFQSGFRKGRSTLDQLARLQHDILSAKNQGQSVLAIFLDLQAAFDLTWTFGILKKLADYGITGYCFHYLRAFLEGRKIQVRVDGELSEVAITDRGTPQGSVISPTLFSLIVNGLPDAVKDSGMVISQFADDSGTWLKGSNMLRLQKRAQAGLDSIWKWAIEWGFKISPTKTVGVLFGDQFQHSLDLNLGGTKIIFEKVVKFLGMYLDKQLTFTHHFKYLAERCERDLNLMRMLRGTGFGSDKNSLLTLYKSLIRPKLDYGAQIYACAKPNALKMVDAIQHKALRIALRALNCTPGALLEEEAGVLPLDLRRKQQSLNFWARVKSRHGSNPVNKLVGTGTFIKGKILKRKHVALPFGASIRTLVEDAGLDKVHVADLRPSKAPPLDAWTH